MKPDYHPKRVRIVFNASSTGMASTAPDWSSSSLLRTSAIHAASTSASSSRLAISRSAKRARSAAGSFKSSCSIWSYRKDFVPHVPRDRRLGHQINRPAEQFSQVVLGSDQLEIPNRHAKIRNEIHVRLRTLLTTDGGAKQAEPHDAVPPTIVRQAVLIELDHPGSICPVLTEVNEVYPKAMPDNVPRFPARRHPRRLMAPVPSTSGRSLQPPARHSVVLHRSER
jgi:hypothetical protein